jgi:hypothetical protein
VVCVLRLQGNLTGIGASVGGYSGLRVHATRSVQQRLFGTSYQP